MRSIYGHTHNTKSLCSEAKHKSDLLYIKVCGLFQNKKPLHIASHVL